MKTNRAWYREPLVWFLISFPLTAVIAGFFTLYLAILSKDGLVVDDYYQKGKEINRSLERDQAAARHGLRAVVQHDAATRQVIVQLSVRQGARLPDKLELHWLHATRDGFDQNQWLVRSSDGRYRTTFPELAPGHWYVQLEAQDWRLQGSLRIPGEVHLELVPTASAGVPAE